MVFVCMYSLLRSCSLGLAFVKSSDIRKWFMKQHDKGNGAKAASKPAAAKPALAVPEKPSSIAAAEKPVN